MRLVTVFSAFNAAEAHVVRSRLEASDFHPIVTHELAALSMEGYSMSTGGILVQVPEDEAGDARELLESQPEDEGMDQLPGPDDAPPV
jgi:hypothetical protein